MQHSSPGVRFVASVPANIAFLKYWGKKELQSQWPANNSLSLTLKQCRTETRASVLTSSEAEADHRFVLNGTRLTREVRLAQKAYAHLDLLEHLLGETRKLALESRNYFPTGCGIASSASGLGALTLAAVAAWSDSHSLSELAAKGWDRQALAQLARLGSGSACRSFWPGLVKWESGAAATEQKMRPLFAADHWQLWDTVVLLDSEAKKVSSSEAHLAAWSSPLFAIRLAGIREKEEAMVEAYAAKNLQQLGPLLEQEAMEMHAVMLTAHPATAYFGEKTSEFLCWLRELRHKERLGLYFTMDAGPNVHIIGEETAQRVLHSHLKQTYPQYAFLCDQVGEGPTLTSEASTEHALVGMGL